MKKWILLEGKLLISASVDYHKELIPWPKSGEQNQTPKGGGLWHIDASKKEITLFGASMDFGPCRKDDVQAACEQTWFSTRWDGYSVFFSDRLEEEAALNNREYIDYIDHGIDES